MWYPLCTDGNEMGSGSAGLFCDAQMPSVVNAPAIPVPHTPVPDRCSSNPFRDAIPAIKYVTWQEGQDGLGSGMCWAGTWGMLTQGGAGAAQPWCQQQQQQQGVSPVQIGQAGAEQWS